ARSNGCGAASEIISGGDEHEQRNQSRAPRSIELTDPVFKLLKQAAERRFKRPDVCMSEDELAMQIIGGVVTKLSIDRACAAWGSYLTDRRAASSIGEDEINKIDAEALDQAAQAAEV